MKRRCSNEVHHGIRMEFRVCVCNLKKGKYLIIEGRMEREREEKINQNQCSFLSRYSDPGRSMNR